MKRAPDADDRLFVVVEKGSVLIQRVHVVGASQDAIVSKIQAGPFTLFDGKVPARAFGIPRPVKHTLMAAGNMLYVELDAGTCECVVFEGKLQDG